MKRVPWHVKGVGPDAREVARDAARRSGVSVGEWLNALIIDAAANAEPAAENREPPITAARPVVPPPRDLATRYASMGPEIEDLKRRVGHRPQFPSQASRPDDVRRGPETISGRERPPGGFGRTGQPAAAAEHGGDDGFDAALAEITARQQTLDGVSIQPSAPAAPAAPAPRERPDPAAVEQQLRDIAGRIRALQGTSRTKVFTGPPLPVAPPAPPAPPPAVVPVVPVAPVETAKRANDGIEAELRRLTEQIESLQAAPIPAVEDLRRDVADVADRVTAAMPEGTAAAIEEQIRTLSQEVVNRGAMPNVEDIAAALRRDFESIAATLGSDIPQRTAAAIGDEIESLHRGLAAIGTPPRAEDITDALRHDLVEIGAMLQEALPTGALTALEQEVRALGERIDASLSHALESASDASDGADALWSDRMAAELLQQIEQAIGALHGLVSHVASQDAVDGLARDVHALADMVERNRHGSDADVIMTLDRRLAEMAEVLEHSRPPEHFALPPEFDSAIERLTERLQAIETRTADPAVLHSLQEGVAALIEKFELSEQRLGRLDDVEHGIGDLLAQVVELRAQNERSLQAIKHELVTSAAQAVSTPAEAIRRDVASLKDIQTSLDRRTNDTFEAVYGTLEQMVDRLATLEQGYRQAANAVPPVAPLRAAEAPSIEPADHAPMAEATPVRHDPAQRPASGSARQAAPSAQGRASLNSELPPDAPLEPGSGLRRARVVANAVDRIAASEAANTAVTTAKPAETAPSARSSFVAAARRAAQAVASGQPESKSDKAAAELKEPTARPSLMQRLGPRIKSVIVGISVVMLVLGALRLALDLFYNGEPSGPPPAQEQVRAPARSDDAPPSPPETPAPAAPATPAPSAAPPAPAPSVTPAPPDPPRTGRGASLEQPAPPAPRAVAALPGNPAFGQVPISGAPSDFVAPLPVVPAATGSLPARTPPAPEQSVPVLDLARNPLPATIGSKALVNAAANGDLGASFEIGLRYAEGRNVPQDLALAAAWFDRAARSGMALAQFRLGSMYEKGVGVKKDLTEARRLYLAASDKGNAKAMHNLAVLYAEGADGKPDYAVAAQWFNKAAAYGVVDSQYNLAILYARGLGVERSMAESYKWFALAAKGGDKDAGAKRDEVAARLDPAQFDSARKAVDAFVAEPQPDEAVATKAPAGGWDQVAAATPAKPKSR